MDAEAFKFLAAGLAATGISGRRHATATGLFSVGPSVTAGTSAIVGQFVETDDRVFIPSLVSTALYIAYGTLRSWD